VLSNCPSVDLMPSSGGSSGANGDRVDGLRSGVFWPKYIHDEQP
jgi:hypothetical protein